MSDKKKKNSNNTSNKKKSLEKLDETKKIEVMEEEKATEKKEKETFENGSKTSRILKKVWNIVFWTLFVCLFTVWIIDFIQVKREEEPIFCISEKIHEYEDGTTKECVGLGYKVYTYDRKSLNIKSQFSPFFVKMEE